jgi:hypothetical protein
MYVLWLVRVKSFALKPREYFPGRIEALNRAVTKLAGR